jgi:hypothetical protein
MDWRRSGFPSPDHTSLYMPVVKEFSLMDLLEADPMDLEAVHFAGARMALGGSRGQDGGLTDPFM